MIATILLSLIQMLIFEESVVKKMMDAFDEETVIVAPLTLDAKGNRQLPMEGAYDKRFLLILFNRFK